MARSPGRKPGDTGCECQPGCHADAVRCVEIVPRGSRDPLPRGVPRLPPGAFFKTVPRLPPGAFIETVASPVARSPGRKPGDTGCECHPGCHTHAVGRIDVGLRGNRDPLPRGVPRLPPGALCQACHHPCQEALGGSPGTPGVNAIPFAIPMWSDASRSFRRGNRDPLPHGVPRLPPGAFFKTVPRLPPGALCKTCPRPHGRGLSWHSTTYVTTFSSARMS
jgi:hypothetical protein